MIESKSLFGIKGSNFDVRIEYNEDYVIVHLPSIEKFNKETLIEMQDLLVNWLQFLKTLGKDKIHAAVKINSKENKLTKLLNFKYLGSAEDMNIYSYEE